MRTITLEELKNDLTGSNVAIENINQIVDLCGASPMHITFNTDKISIETSYPECIVFHSGISSIVLSQIKRIVKESIEGRSVYNINCGNSADSEIVVMISPI